MFTRCALFIVPSLFLAFGAVAIAEPGDIEFDRPGLTDDGLLDFFDLQVFLNAYAAGDLTADWNGDEFIDFFDVSSYFAAFAAGCP